MPETSEAEIVTEIIIDHEPAVLKSLILSKI